MSKSLIPSTGIFTSEEKLEREETRKGFLKRIDDIASDTENLQTQCPHAQQVTNMSNVKFSSYSGKQSEGIVKWKKALNRNFDFFEWDQHRYARYIPTLLSKKGLRYYESLPETTTCNYKGGLDALEEKFSQKSRGALQVNSLLDRCQLPNERVESYAHSMNVIFDKYEVTDEYVKLTSFIRGLKSTIKQDLLKQRPSKFNQCEEFALIIEAADLEAVSLADTACQ